MKVNSIRVLTQLKRSGDILHYILSMRPATAFFPAPQISRYTLLKCLPTYGLHARQRPHSWGLRPTGHLVIGGRSCEYSVAAVFELQLCVYCGSVHHKTREVGGSAGSSAEEYMSYVTINTQLLKQRPQFSRFVFLKQLVCCSHWEGSITGTSLDFVFG